MIRYEQREVIKTMNRSNLIAVSAICALLMFAVGHAESRIQIQCWNDSCQQPTNLADAIRPGVPTFHFAQATVDDKRDYDKIDNLLLDRAVVRQLYQAARLIKSACSSEKTQAEKISSAEKGLRALLGIATDYEHQEPRLRTRTLIWLGDIRAIFAHTQILKPFVPFDEWVKVDNVYSSFVTFYRFYYQLAKTKKFKVGWARDTAQGLACLYE